MAISQTDVLHVARLARLELRADEAEGMARELDAILGYVKKLDELDTKDVEPTLQVSADRMPFRADVVVPSLDKREVLAQAPRADEAGFLVPGFVDET